MNHQQSSCLPAASSGSPAGSSNDHPLVDKTWKKECILGSGAFGVISLWRNIKTNDYIAIKQSRFSQNTNPGATITGLSKSAKDRWRQEVELMHRLDHPNVVKSIPVPECLEVKGALALELPSLGMEYCSGGDLRKLLSQPEFVNGLPEVSVRRILEQISSALLYLHSQRIIHRDLKPENIVLKPRKDAFLYDYKLIDLGYCKELDQNSLASSFVGTLQYLAPELFICGQYTSAVDNWSFGLLTHEILTGKRPFLPNSPPAQWIPAVKNKKSEDLCAWIDARTNQVMYDREICQFNLVSSVLKQDLEVFLRTVLDYDPTKRGGKIAFQTLIETTLKKTVIQVFVMNTLQVYSYEVKPEMKMIELKVLIESNTGFSRSDQVILVPPVSFPFSRTSTNFGLTVSTSSVLRSLLFSGELGSSLDQENALKCILSNSCNTTGNSHSFSLESGSPRTLFLFHKSHLLSFTQYSVSSIIPPSVEAVLLYPTKLVTYEDQRATWPHFIWVAQVLIKKYNFLIEGHDAFLHYVIQLRENTMTRMRQVLVLNNTLQTKRGMIQEQLIFLINRIKSASNESSLQENFSNNSTLTALLNSSERIVRELSAISSKESLQPHISSLHQASRQIDSHSNKCLKEKIFDPHNPICECLFSESFREHTQVYQMYHSMLTIFEDMRKMSREERSRHVKQSNSSTSFDNTPMVKVICDIFQLMEKLIRSNYQSLSQLLELSSTINTLSKEFKKSIMILENEVKATQKIYNEFMMEVVSFSIPTLQTTQDASMAANGPRTNAKMIEQDFCNKIDRLTESIQSMQIREESVEDHHPYLSSCQDQSPLHTEGYEFSRTISNHAANHHSSEVLRNTMLEPTISNESSWSIIN